MSELDTSQPTPTPGTDPASAPSATAATPQPAPTDGDFVQIPRDHLSAYGGSHHEALRLAKLGSQFESSGLLGRVTQLSAQHKVSVADVLRYMGAEDEAEPAAPAQDPSGMATSQPNAAPAPVVTDDRLQEVVRATMKGVFDERDQKTAEEKAVADRAKTIQDAKDSEDTACRKLLEDLKIELPSDGSRNTKADIVAERFYGELYRQKADSIPAWITDDEQRKEYIHNAASPALMKSVAEQARKDLADFGLESASDLAREQGTVATGTSLGAGPGAATTLPKGEDLTPEQEKALVTQGMSPTWDEELAPTASELRAASQPAK